MVSNSKKLHYCLSCERSEQDIPLVALRYDGDRAWICSQCLPTLIHRPYQLAGKLKGAEEMEAPPE